MTTYPLEGIRVINFGMSVVAPLTGRFLSEYGAEVIKVESRGRIDSLRYSAPLAPDLQFDDRIETGNIYMEINRGSKNIQANLKNPRAIDLIKKLVAISDVVIENYSPGVMKKMGLGYEDIKQVNPGIVMISESAVGQTGPHYDLMTYGPTIASICGMQNMLGYPDGEPAQDYAVADYNGANFGTFLILGALRHRMKTGEGQHIDLGQAAPMLCLLGEPMMDYSMNKRVAGMQGNRRMGFVPHNNYRCKPDYLSKFPAEDQWVSIAVKTEEEWRSLCNVMGNPPWCSEERFASRAQRWQNQEELDQKITGWTINYTGYEVTEMLQQAGVAAMAVLDKEMRGHDLHIKARETYRLLDTAVVKGVPTPTEAIKMSRSGATWRRTSRLGEDNNYVYGDLLGLTKEEIAQLMEEKAIF